MQGIILRTEGHLSGSVVEQLPLAQGVIPGSWDRVLHRAPHREVPLILSLERQTEREAETQAEGETGPM